MKTRALIMCRNGMYTAWAYSRRTSHWMRKRPDNKQRKPPGFFGGKNEGQHFHKGGKLLIQSEHINR